MLLEFIVKEHGLCSVTIKLGRTFYYYYYYYYYLLKLKMGFYLVAVVLQYAHKQHTSHKITHHTQTNTAHKTTQTIKDTLPQWIQCKYNYSYNKYNYNYKYVN
jgi:hypothetical protein